MRAECFMSIQVCTPDHLTAYEDIVGVENGHLQLNTWQTWLEDDGRTTELITNNR